MSTSGDKGQHEAGDQKDASTPFQPQPQSLLRPRSATINSEQLESLSSSSGTQGSTHEFSLSAVPGSYSLDQGTGLGNFDRLAPPPAPNQNLRPTLRIIEEPRLRLSCPYYKRSPNKEPKQRSCVYPGFKNIARLKEHLYRHHIQLRCLTCNETFKNDTALEQHHSAETPCAFRECQRDYVEGLDQDQRRKLKKREPTSDTKTDEDKWRDIYRILFPSDEAVPTPYPKEARSPDLEDYRRYCQDNSERVLENRLNAAPNDFWSGPPLQVESRMKSLMRDVQEQLFGEFHTQLDQNRHYYVTARASATVNTASDGLTLADSTPTGTTLIDIQTEAMGQLPLPSPEGSEQHQDTEYDYASIMSNDEDIASKIGNHRSREEVLAVKELGNFFAELEDLRPLHHELLGKFGSERFSENYRRILKVYFLGLRAEAKTTVEKQTALVLRKRFNRYSIGQRVADSLQAIEKDDSSLLNELSSRQVQKELGDWLAKLDNTGWTAPQQRIDERDQRNQGNENTDESTDDSTDEAEDGDHYEDIGIASIEQAKAFLRRGDPFRNLVLQLRLLALPLSIRDVLDMASRDSIAISSINDNSLMNRAKAFMEDYTGAEWDWWPLMPRVPDVTKNKFRLQWELCGKLLYSEISPKDAESLRNILAVVHSNPAECSDYKTNTVSLSQSSPSVNFFEKIRYWAKQNFKTSSFAPNPSTAQQRYTPPGAARACSGTPSNSNSGQSTVVMPSLSAVQSEGFAKAYGADHNGTPGFQSNGLRIIFGIRNKYGLNHIETIGTRDDLDDSSFFGELKSRHDAYRSFVHR